MMQRTATEQHSEQHRAKLQKQLAEYSQYQGLALMPAWLPVVPSAINHTPTAPERVIYVPLFHAGSLVCGIGCSVAVRRRIVQLKRSLTQLEAAPKPDFLPPIPTP